MFLSTGPEAEKVAVKKELARLYEPGQETDAVLVGYLETEATEMRPSGRTGSHRG